MDKSPGRIVGELAGAVRTAFGMTRHNRLSDHLANSLQLYAAAQEHPALDEAASKLARVVNLQADQLLQVVTNRPRRWDWSTFLGGSVITVPLGVVTWALWAPMLLWFVKRRPRVQGLGRGSDRRLGRHSA
jgi:hypothetical protein